MITHILKSKMLWLLLAGLIGSAAFLSNAKAQSQEEEGQLPQPILLTEPKESFEERMARKITLDVRDMNIVDVIKFLAQKGEFNIVVSPTIDGRATVMLQSVGVKDALDIVAISNRLAYHVENDIVQIMTAAEYEALYGKPFGDKTQVSIVHLQYAKPSYVLAALDSMKSNIGKIIIDEDTGSVVLVDTPAAIETMKKAIAQIERPLDTLVFNLKYARADVVAEKLRSRIDAKAVGSITADERSNQILVRVFPGRQHEVEKIIRSLDEITKEVLIEAKVLQIILKPNYDVGLDWSGQVRNKLGEEKVSFSSLNMKESVMSSSDKLAGNFSRIGVGSISATDFATAIRAVQSVSDTKILSSPQILVTNNEEAKIHIGDTVPYIVGTTVGTANPVVSDDVRFIDVGLKLNVIPTINEDGMVTMRLRPEISSIVGTISSSNSSKIPQVNKTEIDTQVMVKDGQTIVLAGLRKEDKSHSKTGVPILMNIPVIGNAFSRTSDAITSTEIVILITPHIVKPNQDYSKVKGSIKPPKTYNDGVQPKAIKK